MTEVTQVVMWQGIDELEKAQQRINEFNDEGFVFAGISQSPSLYGLPVVTVVMVRREQGASDKTGRIVQQQSNSIGSVQSIK